MTRKEYLNKLSLINSAIVCGLSYNLDTGFEFTVLTSEGALTSSCDFAFWPCSEHKITPEIHELQKKIQKGDGISDEELIKIDFIKDICTYCNPIDGIGQINGDKLKTVLKGLCSELSKLKFHEDFFYSFVRLEDWAKDVLLFDTKEEMRTYFYEKYRHDVLPYINMNDSEIKEIYNLANEEGWDSLPVFSTNDNS